MFRKLTLVSVLLFAITACGGPDTEPVDLSGTWETVDNDNVVMTAQVSGGELEIIWITDATTYGLYWRGDVPESAVPGEVFVSNGDTQAMDASLLGSMASTKEFKFASDRLSFDFTVLGVTQTIFMERV